MDASAVLACAFLRQHISRMSTAPPQLVEAAHEKSNKDTDN
jgi:hypothetical protein